MMQIRWIVGGLGLLTLLACGGGGVGLNQVGEISGVVTDANGDVVRGARVLADGKETFSNSSGAFMLDGVREGDHLVIADITQNGVPFSGQNVARVFRLERTKSLGIEIVRDSLQASIHGVVRDRNGNRLAGARVFAIGNSLTSSLVFTNDNGDYTMNRLMAGVTYQLTASARTYGSDLDQVNLAAGENQQFDFTLSEGQNPAMPAPENLSAVAWTSPFEETRSNSQQRAGIEAIKNMLLPKRQSPANRTTIGGSHVEVDLFWDVYTANYVDLLGFGIYRSSSSGGSSIAIDFMRDPNAFFFQDLDDELRENEDWWYEITALNTQYPDTFNSESGFSNRYGVVTLGDMELRTPILAPLTFRWNPASGAEEYVVYLFDRFPGVGVSSIWNNESFPTTGTSQLYTGPALQSGQRYYYIVLGLANNNDSRTISIIDDFIAN